MNTRSDIPFPGNNSAIIRFSLLPSNRHTEENNNLICEAVGCDERAAFSILIKAGRSHIPLNLCKKCIHRIFADQEFTKGSIKS
jgi:hypothetical protein